ncbi:MAG TPA: DNA-processing protein DprA [Acidimicrobiales bacterium]
MIVDERVSLLAAILGTKLRWSEIASQIDDLGSSAAMLSRLQVSEQTLFSDGSNLDVAVIEAQRLIDEWSRAGMHFATFQQANFPSQLLSIHQRPPFVMWKGQQSSQDSSGVAIVGTRSASPEGITSARALASEMVARGVTVVSGLAAGIDSAAHMGALDAGGRTVAVIGTGLKRSYPRQNADLQRRIEETGMVLSQFLPDSPPTKTSFPMRNAIMSGFASATVVIEAGWQSGARMQARLALEHGRQVFLMSQLREHDWACEYSKRPGAHFVSSVDEILSLLDRSSLWTDQLVDS